MPQVQADRKLVDLNGIRQDIVQNGIARRLSPHPIVLKGSSEQTKWYVQHDKTYLRYVNNFDQVVTRSDFASDGVVLATPGIQDGLRYGHYELEAIQGDIIPYDARQRRLAEYFRSAEDRIFFTGPDPGVGTAKNLALTDTGANSATITAAAPGTYASLAAAGDDAEWDLTSATTGLSTMSAFFARWRLNLNIDELKPYTCGVVVSPDVKTRLESLLNTNTDSTLQDTMQRGLDAAFGPGRSEFITSKYLGATMDYNNQEIEIGTVASTNACFMLLNGDAFSEVRTSPIINRHDEDPVDGLRHIIEEKYVPIFKQPFANIYSGTVDITS